MKLLYKKVLKDLIVTTYLNDNLYLEDGKFLDDLQTNSIFDTFECEDISQEKKSKEKLECMVRILMVKDDVMYNSFKRCLNKDYKHVVEKMNRLEIELGAACTKCSDYIKQWLKENYVDREGSSVDFDAIQSLIIKNVRDSKEHNDTLIGVLDEEFMFECITEAFPTVKKDSEIVLLSSSAKQKSKSKSSKAPQNRTYTRTVISNLTKTINSDSFSKDIDKEFTDSDKSDTEQEVFEHETKIIKLNVEEFSRLVEIILSENVPEWDTSIPKKIIEQKVDSEVYDEMTDDDKKDLVSRMGERVRLQVEWKKIKEGKSEILQRIRPKEARSRPEHMRRFDQPVSAKIKYTAGNKAPTPPSRPGNLLQPVHVYYMPENTDKKQQVNIQHLFKEILSFSAGCLNDKTNGTFHCGSKHHGEISGCVIDKDVIDSQLTKSIRENFKEYQVETVLKCIRPVKCIDVIDLSSPSERKYVLEVDVVPNSVIVGTQSFFIKGKKKGSFLFYRYRNSCIQSLHRHEIDDYMQERDVIFQQRQEIEKHKIRSKKEDLNKRLKDFLCCGESEFEESLYPVLLLTYLQADDRVLKSENQLFTKVPWRAIIDFNAKDDESSFQVLLEKQHCKAFITYTVDDLNPHKREEKVIKKTKETIIDSSLPTWIYCNGTGEKGSFTDPRGWIHEHCESFRKVAEFYNDIIPDNRARIIIPLFEKENKVITEAILELLLKFGKQCLILSPSRSIASMCWDELSRRPNAFPPDVSIDDCFLIGLPWNQIGDCISNIVKEGKTSNGVLIPRTHGVPYAVDLKEVNELSDLDIVSINACQEFEKLKPEEKLIQQQESREKYYGGSSVEWINFYFKEDQVLRRNVHKELETHVKEALEAYDDCLVVQKVAVYHQPGSGGSTTSRQILWDLRESYRCCVVKKITSETRDQIGRLRVIGEESDEGYSIKPVLVLLDDNDEDAITQFAEDLEIESAKYECDVFCVLLICFRVSVLPLDRPLRYVMLRQELSSYENNWFKEKYENLLKQHEQKRGCDPKTLLAFNIMKENFNEASINKSVKAFVCDKSIEPKQLRMLKHLSFLNAFDLHFQSVPLSCFDPIMAPPIQWIRDIPPSFRVLTSRCNRQGYGGKILSIRMSNYLLSRSVLNTIIELESENGELRKTIGEVALDVMSSACFRTKFYKEEHKILQKIIGDISKKRDRGQNGKGIGKLEKFSPLITELLEQCDKDQAIQIVSETYDITNDALVSQQLARLHAELENWCEAFTAIDNGIDQKPYNSYLVHTKGHLYKEHMQALFSQYSKENAEVPISEINNAIKYTKLSIDCFRTCQELSENQDSSQPNPAGYESEILVAVELVRLLKKCPVLRTYAHVRTLIQREDISRENQVFLERLPESIAITIDKLERIIHGTIRHFFHSHSRSLYTVNKIQLDKHKQEFTAYFVEDNRSDTSMSKDAHCQVDVWSLLSALRVHEIHALMRMIQSMSKNTSHLSKPRLRIFLAICLSVSVSNPSILPIREDVLMNTSRRYYESSSSTKNELAKLESYLYFTVFHWPLQSRQKIRNYLSPYSTWSAAVKLWLEEDRSTSGKQKRNDKILFYFGKSHDYPNVLKLETLSSISALARFKGTVNQNGTEIEIMIDSFQSTQPSFIWIPFHKKITRSTIYNRVVEVVIGVGLQGPRADWIEKPSSFRLGQNFCRIQLSSSLENNYHGYRSTEPHAASDQDRHNILKGSRQQSFERNLQYPARMRNTRQRQNFRIPDCHSRYDMSVRDLQGDSTYISNRSVHRHPDNGFTSDSLQFPYQHPTSLNAGPGTSMARVPAHFHIPPPPTMPAVGVNFYNNPGVYSGGDRNQRYSGNNYSSTNRVLQRMNNWPEVGRDRLSDLRDSRHEGNGFIRAPETVLRGYRGTRQRRQSHRFQNPR